MYFMRDSKGNERVFTRDQIIDNAAKREASGERPSFRYDFGSHGLGKAGYLVVSMYSGCLVAIHHDNGNWQIIHGWQGDFVCC